ncbi:hypothetical protein [Cellulosimicrobium cellulans]|uniref:hypothetical protein n=1 Tax=Cellulosimicrobium cellulans TaxID=1710 RepID=UPI0005BD521C|nr:hypothetical protein [Cellulosimicrobium cellulans]
MSTFIALAQEASVHAASVDPGVVVLAAQDGGGLLGKASQLNTSAQSLARGVAITLGILFVIIAAISSRGGMARILIAGLAAGLFIWITFNVTQVKDLVGEDLAAGVVSEQVQVGQHLHYGA